MSSPATLLQLVARGKQDVYLTDNPQFTFFKHVYRRYTPFAIESIPIEFDGTPDFGKRISCLIPRKGDLLHTLYLEVTLPPLIQAAGASDLDTYSYWVNNIGHALIQDVSIEIGEREIDKHTGEWLHIWSTLTTPSSKQDGFNQLVGNWEVYPPASSYDLSGALTLSIPLRFWFCNSVGAALPLIALQASPIRVVLNLRPFSGLWWSLPFASAVNAATTCAPSSQPCTPQIPTVSLQQIRLFGDYLFLEKEERKRFAGSAHEYLIEQLQYTPPQSVPCNVSTAQVNLMFNHPCKEFFWVVQQDRLAQMNEWFNYSNKVYASVGTIDTTVPLSDLLSSGLIRLDGNDRFYPRDYRYFRIQQPYQYHTTIPKEPSYIYMYSFSLRPEDEQPSGSINCSRFNNITLNLTFDADNLAQNRTVRVYTKNYNILRIIGGLGGVAFIA